jgi:ABC-type bacteriocin/lantibiotic exporter with double-glycine peptidase domain
MAEVMARLTASPLRSGAIAAGIAAIALAALVARAWRERRLHAFGAALERDLGHRLVAQLVQLPPAFFHPRTTSDLDARLTGVPALARSVARGLGSALTDAPMGVAYLGVLFAWSRAMAAADLAVVIAYVAIRAIVRRVRERSSEPAARSDAELRQLESQLIAQRAVLRGAQAAGSEPATVASWETLQHGAAVADRDQARSHALTTGALDGLGMLIPLSLLAVGGILVGAGELSVPALIGTNYLACALIRPIDALITTVESLGAIRHALDRLDDVLLEPGAIVAPDAGQREAI